MTEKEKETLMTKECIENLNIVLDRVREAQKEFSKFSQEQVDRIFKDAAIAANQARIPLAKMAVEETGMGVVEDKVIKLIQKANNRGGTDNISVAYLIRDKEGEHK